MGKHTHYRHAPPPPRPELSDNPVKMCCEISRIFHTLIRENCDIDGVMSQPGARLVLSVLAVGDGINQRELVSRTHLRAPTVSVIVKKMVDEGMAELRADENDMRVKKVYLTEYGRQTDREGIRKLRAMDAIGLDGIDKCEYDVLMRLLERIRENLLNSDKRDAL